MRPAPRRPNLRPWRVKIHYLNGRSDTILVNAATSAGAISHAMARIKTSLRPIVDSVEVWERKEPA